MNPSSIILFTTRHMLSCTKKDVDHITQKTSITHRSVRRDRIVGVRCSNLMVTIECADTEDLTLPLDQYVITYGSETYESARDLYRELTDLVNEPRWLNVALEGPARD